MDEFNTSGAGAWETAPVATPLDEAFIQARMIEVYHWCQSTEAIAIARRILQRKRLVLAPEDLVLEVQARVCRTIRNRPESFETFEVANYCTRSMGNYVKTLMSRRPMEEVLVGDDQHSWVPFSVDFAVTEVDHGDVDRFRACVEALGGDPVYISAALTLTSLRAFNNISIDDAPWPKAGVRDDRRDGWPALWFATRNPSLFPARGRRDHQARIRQRHLERIDALWVRAGLAATMEGPS